NNWALYEVSMDCPPDSDPPSLRINVRIVFAGSIWIKDLEIITMPLPGSPAPPAPAAPPKGEPAKEVTLKKFDPKTDKPFQTEFEDRRVTVESDAWRINALARPPGASPAILQLFDLPKQNVGRSVVILRFMMKTEKVERYATVHLSAGGETERLLGDSVRGTTDWKRYELRCAYSKAEPADVRVSVEIGGFGTM